LREAVPRRLHPASGVLESAGIERARVLVVATAEGLQTRRIIALARQANPRIDTAVRTHSAAELAHLEREGIGVAIMGARELALGLMDYALRSLGIARRRRAPSCRIAAHPAKAGRSSGARVSSHRTERRSRAPVTTRPVDGTRAR
jgi:voltage-gated potassium channel Kch